MIIKQSQQPPAIRDNTFLDKISFQEDYFSGQENRSLTVLNPSVPLSRHPTSSLQTVLEKTEIEVDGTSASASNMQTENRETSQRDPSILNYINTAEPNNQ